MMDSDPRSGAPAQFTSPSFEPPPERGQILVPALAVAAVAVVAVAAAIWGRHTDEPGLAQRGTAPPARQEVVRAPPLVKSPPARSANPPAQIRPERSDARIASNAMGAGSACANCGVVEWVTSAKPDRSFQMRIRMDDGSVRTVEQRGALAAGTRVVVERGSVRLVPGPSQG